MSTRTVLVTGAAGLVGAEVTARLAAAGWAVLALVHRNGRLVRNNGRPLPTRPHDRPPGPGDVVTVHGDVTADGLGLDAAVTEGLDLIVHTAALTDFGRADEAYERINVAGTGQVLDLAGRAGTPVVHVSTAYVCGRRAGVVLEDELDTGQRFANAYERSKFAAEQLVHRARAAGLPAAIVRPGIVTGTEHAGVVRDFRSIYVVLKLTTEGKLRTLPGRYDATPNLVPADYVADVVTEVAARFDEAEGGTFHAVGDRELDLRTISDVLAEYPSFRVATYVPPSVFDRDALPGTERRYYDRVGALYASYFQRRVHFDATATRDFLDRRPARTGPAYLRRVLDHAVRRGFLGIPLPPPDAVLAGLGVGGTP
ncbi:SDR family oxidoreductase [Streptomyces sp. NPDC002004]